MRRGGIGDGSLQPQPAAAHRGILDGSIRVTALLAPGRGGLSFSCVSLRFGCRFLALPAPSRCSGATGLLLSRSPALALTWPLRGNATAAGAALPSAFGIHTS